MLKKLNFYDFFKADGEKRSNYRHHSKKDKIYGEVADFIQLIKGWEQIIGKEFASNTMPLRISQKKLIILTPHSTFSQQLIFNEQFIIQKIIEKFPSFKNQIHHIRFKVNPKFFHEKSQSMIQTKTKKEIPITLPHKYSPEYIKWKKEAESIYANIEDQDLKKQLVSLYIQSCFAKQ